MVKIAVIMGSKSDWEVMKEACQIFEDWHIHYVKDIVSAHRTPEDLFKFAKEAKDQGFGVIIAGAGGAAHLPGMVASLTTLPVIGVPIKTKKLEGLDSLLSIVQMPGGVPVGTMAINGAKNAALYALRILSVYDEDISIRLKEFADKQKEQVNKDKDMLVL
jgi:5-(carboxyamino)imidazole ribonucleotide mutase